MNPVLPWECPELTEVNRLPMRATLQSMPTPALALTDRPETSPWRLSLNGRWRIRMVSGPDQVQPADIADRAATRDWPTIPVPANWNLHGFGKPPQYTNITMPFPNEPPRVPSENPTAIYRTSFRLPADWAGQRVVLHFGGAESCLFVYLNGQFLGMSKDSRLPAEFDASPLVRSGRNSLAAVCVQYSDASYVEDQDHWWLAGLYRDVYLYRTGPATVEDIFARGGLDPAGRQGRFAATVKLTFTACPTANYTVRAQLYDASGKPVFKRPLTAAISASYRDHYYEAQLEARVPRVRPWSPEIPNLYRAVFSLHDARGNALEHTGVTLGFRSFAIRDRQFLVNGRPVLIKGTNHHDNDPDHGKAVRREVMERDVQLLKQFNFNAIRTSHYPSDPYLYDLCDRYGILVLDEANIENHANYGTLAHQPRWARHYFERIQRMVLRDKNHASIFGWSLCNESGYGENHDRAAAWIRAYDPDRIVHNEGSVKPRWDQGGPNQYGPGGERANDFIDPMYPPVRDIIQWAKTTRERRPFIMCEYSSATGNSNGSLREYWDAIHRYRGLQGGFIWQWMDHALRARDPQGREYWAYGGDFGDQPNDKNFCCNGLVGPDRTPHPVMWEFKKLVQPIEVGSRRAASGAFIIRNTDFFRNADWLRGAWSVTVDGRSVQSGRCPALNIPPGGRMTINLDIKPLRLEPRQRAHVNFRFQTIKAQPWCPAGHEVAWEQFDLPAAGRRPATVRPVRATANAKPVAMQTQDRHILLQAGDTELVFDRPAGRIERLSIGDTPLITDGPRFNIWRAPVDNDGLKGFPGHTQTEHKPLGRWYRAGYDALQATTLAATVRRVGEAVVLAVRQRFQPAKSQGAFTHRHTYTVMPSGQVLCEHEFLMAASLIEVPRLGIRMSLNGALDQLRWLGRGPHETYPDRKAGAPFGLYGGPVDAQYVPYVVPQENGNKEDVRWFELTDAAGVGLRIEAPGEAIRFSAHRFTPEALTAACHLHELQREPAVTVLIDAALRGLGTGACGPDTLPEYLVPPGRYRLAFEIIPKM